MLIKTLRRWLKWHWHQHMMVGTRPKMTPTATRTSWLRTSKPRQAETAPDDEETSERPERQARKGVARLLSRIAEEPESDDCGDEDEAGTGIGNYKFQDEDHGSWRAGLGESDSDDEYLAAIGYDSHGTGRIATASTKQPLGRRHGSIDSDKVPKPRPHTNKVKATEGSKRKHRDELVSSTSVDTDCDSESEVKGGV